MYQKSGFSEKLIKRLGNTKIHTADAFLEKKTYMNISSPK